RGGVVATPFQRRAAAPRARPRGALPTGLALPRRGDLRGRREARGRALCHAGAAAAGHDARIDWPSRGRRRAAPPPHRNGADGGPLHTAGSAEGRGGIAGLVARIERSEIREPAIPDFASLNPGYDPLIFFFTRSSKRSTLTTTRSCVPPPIFSLS